MTFAALPARLAQVRAEIARRQAAGGWRHPVTIVAVTKGFGLEAVEAALAAGLADLGENRVQEALEKTDTESGRRARWHLIGHLQRNKAKFVPGRFVMVHSVDSVELAQELERRARDGGPGKGEGGIPLRALIQVNVAREPQKSGCAPEAAPVVAREAREQQKSVFAHYAHLLVHGTLHLQGYDHVKDADARTMERRESRIITALGYPDPYGRN